MAEKTEVKEVKPTSLAVNNSFIDSLSRQLASKQEYGLQFPNDYSVSNALNGAYLMLKEADKNPLQTCSQSSIATCLMDMATQALNPMKKQCYFIPMGKKLTLFRSYQGTMACAKRAGAKRITAEVIYKGDTFKFHIENGLKVIDEHTQSLESMDNKNIIGAYAIVIMEDYEYIEIMNYAQMEQSWLQGYGYKKTGQGVHQKFTDQMCKKTVISRACKNIINSSDDGFLTESFENTTTNEQLDKNVEDLESDLDEANTVDFEEEPEKVAGEVVDTENPDCFKEDK